MAKARVSIGTATPTGEPCNGPRGPYVTEDHDDEIAASEHRSPRPGGKRRNSPRSDGAAPGAPRRRGPAQP
jgi:hypothetical protein